MATFGTSHDEHEARALAEMYGASTSRALACILIDRVREQAKASEREFRLIMAAVAPRLKRRRVDRATSARRRIRLRSASIDAVERGLRDSER